jgi:hypothetical protein
MPMTFLKLVLAAVACSAAAQAWSAGVDPLTVDIDARDAVRFAGLLARHPQPTAEQLQQGYLDGAGIGVRIFTPYRIKDAQNLARAFAAQPQDYQYAARECLPRLASLQPELRAIYLAYAGLQPQRPLPAVHVVFGAGNSGGTASDTAQVLGLEVMCKAGTSWDEFRSAMRGIFAHETVHSWQTEPSPEAQRDPLLTWALREGVPDYLAALVTGGVPRPDRDSWARAREASLWLEFQRDRTALLGVPDPLRNAPTRAIAQRWFANYGAAPQGWPYEAGYWVGMRIAEAYVARAADRRQAISELIDMRDPVAILKASGYGG